MLNGIERSLERKRNDGSPELLFGQLEAIRMTKPKDPNHRVIKIKVQQMAVCFYGREA